MSLTGKWINSYGSVMNLQQDTAGSGLIFGEYSSSTGSTGRYYVYGWAPNNDPVPTLGQSVALSIFWRSIEGGTGDPSWHFSSGLGGELSVSDAGVESLTLIHAMVAPVPFPGLCPAGTFLDKLVYTRDPSPKHAGHPGPTLQSTGKKVAADPIVGRWSCIDNPTFQLLLDVVSEPYGVIRGELIVGANNASAMGFTDTYATGAGLLLQSVAVTASMGGGKSVALAGNIDLTTGLMHLMTLENVGTPNDATYVSTNTQSLTFRKL